MKPRMIAASVALAFVTSLALERPAAAVQIRVHPAFGLPIAPPIATARRSYPVIGNAFARAGVRYLGPAHLGRTLVTANVNTQLTNEAGLHAYARAANTRGSLYYRRWLSPTAIAAAYGTPGARYAAAAAYFRAQGLSVKTWLTRTMITVTGLQPQIERAFGTKLGTFALNNHRFYMPAAPVALPATLGVASLAPITNLGLQRITSMPGGPPEPINGGFAPARVNGLTPQQLAEAYDLNSAYALGYTGRGVNLGVIGTGPISLADVPTMRTLLNVAGSSTVQVVPAAVSGDTTPPPVTGPCTAGSSTSPVAGCNPEDGEAQLDTEQAALLARDANVLFYLGYNAGNAITGSSEGLALSDDELQQAVNDDRADILSLSFGGCELLDTALNALTPTPLGDATGTDPTIFAELAAEGIAVFVSSGDSGSAGCQRLTASGMSDLPDASYPTTDPNVVGVGGTTTPIGDNGRLTGPITTWGQQTKSTGAEGAGTSILFQTPSFQQRVSSLCAMRCEPDVVLNADPFTGQLVLQNSGAGMGGTLVTPIGGTSASTPDMAAMWAVVLSACLQTSSCKGPAQQPVTDPVTGYTAPAPPSYRLGNPNFLWYPLLDAGNQSRYQATFYDIVYGNDAVPPIAAITAAGQTGIDPYTLCCDPGSVSAGTGYDVATGLGYPFGRELVRQFVGP